MSARCGSSHGGSFSPRPRIGERFVDGEPGLQRRDLEQHAAGLAEVDRLEVAAVAHLGDLAGRSEQQLLAQSQLLLFGRHGHRDVMHRAEAVDRRLGVGVVRRRRSTCPARRRSRPDADAAVRFVDDACSRAAASSDRRVGLGVAHDHRDAVQPANRRARRRTVGQPMASGRRGRPRSARTRDPTDRRSESPARRSAARRR